MSVEAQTRWEAQAGAAGGRASWGAPVIGGLTALGTGITLIVLGIAIMYSAASNGPHGAFSWMLTWSLIVPVPSAFVGGLVCARTAGPLQRGAGALHGLASWGIATAAAAALVFLYFSGGPSRILPPLTDSEGAGSAGAASENPGARVAASSRDLLSSLDTQLLSEGRPGLSEARLAAVLSALPAGAWAGTPEGIEQVASALQRAMPMPREIALQFGRELVERYHMLRRGGADDGATGGAARGRGAGASGGAGAGAGSGFAGNGEGAGRSGSGEARMWPWPAEFWAGSVATYFWFMALSLAVSAAAGALGGGIAPSRRQREAARGVRPWTQALRDAET